MESKSLKMLNIKVTCAKPITPKIGKIKKGLLFLLRKTANRHLIKL